MAQGARRSAMSSTQIRQVAKQAQVWVDGLAELHERIRPRFGRVEPRRRALGYLRGLLGALERKNSWWLAEQAGELTPEGCNGCSTAPAGTLTVCVMTCASTSLNTWATPAAVLVLDETGFLKKGTHSAGVARQYTGTAGRIENAQVGVFLAYATLAGVALIDRDLYLPKVWTDDRERCRAAGTGDQVAFQTKPQLAQAMLQRAVAARVPFRWVTGDSVYGGDQRLRVWLEQQAIPHVLAVKCTEPLLTMTDRGPGQVPAEQLLAQVEPEQWLRLSAGEGSKQTAV